MLTKRLKTARHSKKRKKTIVDLWREWNVPDGAYRRFKGLRGIYWYWLSRDVRKSEWEQWDKKCLTCLDVVEDWQNGDCGHVIASSHCGEYLRFFRLNLTLQHKGCNSPKFTPDAGIRNAIHYDMRHGVGSTERLLSLKKMFCKEPTQEQYRYLIRGLKSYQESVGDNSKLA